MSIASVYSGGSAIPGAIEPAPAVDAACVPLSANRGGVRRRCHILARLSRFFPVRDAVHLSYVYTPLRDGWMPGANGRGSSPLLGGPRAALRALDRRSTNGATSFVAISTEVQRRIREVYNREATVIFPAVDVGYFSDASATHDIDKPSGYVLGVSRWIRYKRLDLVIEAAEWMGLPVVIAGHDPLEVELLAQARDTSVPVRLAKGPSDSELRTLYPNAVAVVFPAEEDLGVVPVEAQASGAPVIDLALGGSLHTVAHDITGILVPEQTAETLADGLGRAIQLGRIDASDHLEKFMAHAFRTAFRRWVGEHSQGRNSQAKSVHDGYQRPGRPTSGRVPALRELRRLRHDQRPEQSMGRAAPGGDALRRVDL